MELLCRKFKGTSYEYSFTIEDYFKFCGKHDGTGQLFESFLKLNRNYEENYIQEEFVLGMNLLEEYCKQCEGEADPDDDDYKTKIKNISSGL